MPFDRSVLTVQRIGLFCELCVRQACPSPPFWVQSPARWQLQLVLLLLLLLLLVQQTKETEHIEERKSTTTQGNTGQRTNRKTERSWPQHPTMGLGAGQEI